LTANQNRTIGANEQPREIDGTLETTQSPMPCNLATFLNLEHKAIRIAAGGYIDCLMLATGNAKALFEFANCDDATICTGRDCRHRHLRRAGKLSHPLKRALAALRGFCWNPRNRPLAGKAEQEQAPNPAS
jgi:hypothetical protein